MKKYYRLLLLPLGVARDEKQVSFCWRHNPIQTQGPKAPDPKPTLLTPPLGLAFKVPEHTIQSLKKGGNQLSHPPMMPMNHSEDQYGEMNPRVP